MTLRSSRPEDLNLPNHTKATCTINDETIVGTSMVSSFMKDSPFQDKNEDSVIPLTKKIEKPKYKQVNNKTQNIQNTQQNNFVNTTKKENSHQSNQTSTKNLVEVTEPEKNKENQVEKDKTFSVGLKVKKKLKIREPFLDIVEVESFKIFNLKMTFCEWGTTSDDGGGGYNNDDDLCKQVKECFGKCVII
jgi:hypothetical protein